MFAVRSLFKANTQILKNVAQHRNMSVIATPARNKITKGEMGVLISAMILGWSAIPVWVLVNIKNYRNKE
uniref:SFRICE_035225 n=1 Tax=Spodoptera frugiperda TaxID=7108 RepID=A0A2H1WQB7_SPOFR